MSYRVAILTLLFVLSSVTVPAVAVPAAAVSSAGIPILGLVLGPDGEPLAKAEVHLESMPSTYERARLRLEGLPGPEPVVRSRTRADGTFELAAPAAGMWSVVVAAPGLLTMERRLIPLVEEVVLPAIELQPASKLEVRVVDAKGQPRAGVAGVVTRRVRNDAWRPRTRLAVVGENGKTRFSVGKSEEIQLEVLADGHPLVVAEVSDETKVTIEVQPGVAKTVRVIDRQKRPLAAALAFQGSALLPVGLTETDGLLALTLPAKGLLKLEVSTANRWNGTFQLDPASVKEGLKDLRLDPPATVEGRVLDLSSRDPIAGALVWSVRGESTVTDKHGGYTVEIGVYKSGWVHAAAGGYLRGFSKLKGSGDQDSTGIALAPAGSLTGKVVDDAGGLLAGVSIELQLQPQSGRISRAAQRFMRDGWRGRTSERGVFRVAGLPADVGFQLTCKAEGYAPQTFVVEPLEAFETRSKIKVVMRPGHLAFGLVVDEGDLPVTGAEVRLIAPPPTDDLRAMMRMRRSSQDETNDPVGLTDADGRYEIRDLAGGRYDLEVRASGFAPAKIPGVRLEEAGGPVDLGTVVMVEGARIQGRVVDPDGVAIAGADINTDLGRRTMSMVRRDTGNQTQSDSEGYFTLGDLLPGMPVTLLISRKGFASESVSDLRPPTEEPLVIVLRPAAQIEGRVVNREGDPIHRAMVNAHPDFRAARGVRHFSGASHAETDAEGRFVLEDVEPGVLQVTAMAEGYQQQVQQGVEVAAGAKHKLELVLETGAVVEGTVTTATREPLIQATVSITETQDSFSMGMRGSASGQTDADGHYRATGAAPGTATITVYHQNTVRLTKSIEVKPGNNVVDLVLERGFEVSGQVVSPDGEPVSGAAVSIQEGSQPGFMHFSLSGPQVTTTGDGTFTLTDVSAGQYRVAAGLEGFAPATSELLEVANDVSGVLLTLRLGATLKGRVIGLELDELGALELMAYSQQGGMRRGHVDFSGDYMFDSLAAGDWHVQAQVSGSGRSSSLQVELPEGASEVVKDIEFGTGFTLTGVVLDNGEPVLGATIAANSSTSNSGHGTTGANGRFRIENLKGGSYQVMVMAGMGLQQVEPIELTGDHELRIEVSTGTLSGVVRSTADGEPVSGATIALELIAEGDALLSRQFGFGNRSVTDSRGRFSLLQVRQGNWRVVVTKPGYSVGDATVTVTSSVAPEIEIALTPTEGVSIGLALQSGAPLSSAQIAILDPSGRQLASSTYPVIEGRVKVSTVPPGSWTLVIQAGDGAATRFAVTAPGDQGRVVLPTAGTLHLRVPELKQELLAKVLLTGPDGQPYAGVAGMNFAPGEWVMSSGQSVATGLTPGVWNFSVTHTDGRTWSGSAVVNPGGTTEVSLP